MIEAWIMDILCEKVCSDTGIHWKVLGDTFFAGIEDMEFSAWPATNQQFDYFWRCEGGLPEYRKFHFADALRAIFE
jgi:hypothetical protein